MTGVIISNVSLSLSLIEAINGNQLTLRFERNDLCEHQLQVDTRAQGNLLPCRHMVSLMDDKHRVIVRRYLYDFGAVFCD